MSAVTAGEQRAGARTAPETLLEVSGLTIRYGGVVAIDNVSFAVPSGSVVGLIGPNGAGKTSLIDGLMGAVRPASGRVRFRQQDVTGWPPHRLAQAGMTRTFQSVELFEDLTVAENLLVAAERPSLWRALAQVLAPISRPGQAEADWAAQITGIDHLLERTPRELPHGQRKLVGVARALAGKPSLLLLDEPAAGLDTDETRELGRQLRRLPEHGTTLLLIDHDMSLVLEVCDHIIVIDFGRVIAEGAPDEIRHNDAVIDAYLGRQGGHGHGSGPEVGG